MASQKRVPQDLREMIRSIDPAAHIDAAPRVSAAQLIAIAGEQESPRPHGMRPRRRVLLAPLAAVVVVVVAAVGVLILRGHSGSTVQHAATAPPPSPTISTLPPAAPPPAFSADASPRPVVLIGESVDISGFPSDDTKIAFEDGQVDLSTSLPSTPASRDGYPLISAAAAARRVTGGHECCVTTSTRLSIDSVRLVDHRYATDRGDRPLPTWQFRFTGLPTVVSVLAVAPSARYPSQGNSAGELVTSHHGRDLTLAFVARYTATNACETSYRSFLSVSQNSSAVRISVRFVQGKPGPSTGATVCAGVAGGEGGPIGGKIAPGVAGTRTITLEAPLGNRLVVDLHNHPYVIARSH